MSKVTIAILFATIGLIITATYFDLPYFGEGGGVVLVAGLCYAFVLAKREAALMTYVLTEDQIVPEQKVQKPAQVPQGMNDDEFVSASDARFAV